MNPYKKSDLPVIAVMFIVSFLFLRFYIKDEFSTNIYLAFLVAALMAFFLPLFVITRRYFYRDLKGVSGIAKFTIFLILFLLVVGGLTFILQPANPLNLPF